MRASAGAGIKEPTFLESFGVSFFARGNPDLKPERSRTYDLGVEQWLFGGKLRAEATAFHHEYLDQIAYFVVDFDTFEGSYKNLGKTRGRGLELGVEGVRVPVRLLDLFLRRDGRALGHVHGQHVVLHRESLRIPGGPCRPLIPVTNTGPRNRHLSGKISGPA